MSYPTFSSKNALLSPLSILVCDRSFIFIILNAVITIVSALLNIFAYFSVSKGQRYGRSRIAHLVRVLTVAQLVITVSLMMLEVVWRLPMGSRVKRVWCMGAQFVRDCALYLTSEIIVGISLDRWFDFVHPLNSCCTGVRRKGTVWVEMVIAGCLASPQVDNFKF